MFPIRLQSAQKNFPKWWVIFPSSWIAVPGRYPRSLPQVATPGRYPRQLGSNYRSASYMSSKSEWVTSIVTKSNHGNTFAHSMLVASSALRQCRCSTFHMKLRSESSISESLTPAASTRRCSRPFLRHFLA